MRVPGKKGLIKTGRWLRSRVTSGGLILGYHRVAESDDDVYLNCVRPQYFAEQLAVLREHANPITLDELVEGLQGDSLPPRAVVVTFDDGYADNLYQAWPLLEQYEIPATLFVATGFLGHRFWWDELGCMLLDSRDLPEQFSLDTVGKTHTWRLSPDQREERRKVLQDIYQILMYLTFKARQQALEQLSQQIGPANDDVPGISRALTPAELQAFSHSDLVNIGAHTVTHPFLANLPEQDQRQEIGECKRDLEALLERAVNTFSYPNGSGNEVTWALLREAGYTSACTSYNDVATARSNLFNLPRFWAADQGGSEFASWLLRWLPS